MAYSFQSVMSDRAKRLSKLFSARCVCGHVYGHHELGGPAPCAHRGCACTGFKQAK